MKKVINREKKSKALGEVKPVKNIESRKKSKNLETSLVQKEVLPSPKLQDHIYD